MKRSERKAMRDMLIVVGLHQIAEEEFRLGGEASFSSWNTRLYGLFEIHEQELSQAQLNALAALEHDGIIEVERWEETIDWSPLTSESFMIVEAKVPKAMFGELKKAMWFARDELANGSFMGLSWDINSRLNRYISTYWRGGGLNIYMEELHRAKEASV